VKPLRQVTETGLFEQLHGHEGASVDHSQVAVLDTFRQRPLLENVTIGRSRISGTSQRAFTVTVTDQHSRREAASDQHHRGEDGPMINPTRVSFGGCWNGCCGDGLGC
jgi:hypothetical protein